MTALHTMEYLAYVGPGLGLSSLGALIGLGVAIGSSLLFVVLWPIRQLMKRKKKAAAAASAAPAPTPAAPESAAAVPVPPAE